MKLDLPKKHSNILAALALIACLGILVVMLFPWEESKAQSRSVAMLYRAKQIDTAALTYAKDNSDRLPLFNFAHPVSSFLVSYLTEREILPIEYRLKKVCDSYTWNTNLAGAKLRTISKPEKTWLFHSAKPVSNGRLLVGLADGHVRYMDEDAFHQIESIR